MGRQIEKKWIADGAIDGSKIQLLEGQSIIIEVAGQPVELLKLNENGNATLPQGEVPNVNYVDESIQELQTLLEQDIAGQIATVQSGLDQEILDRQAGDSSTLTSANEYTDAQIAAIPPVDLTPYETIVNVDAKILLAQGYTDTKIAQEVQDRDAAIAAAALIAQTNMELADANLQSQIDTEKGRIDAILEASEADKDSFAEIVSLINSVDTENDTAFAGYVLSNDAEVAAVKDRLDVVEPKVSTLETEMDAAEGRLTTLEGEMGLVEADIDVLQSDIVDLEAKDLDLETRLAKEEEINKFLTASFYNDSAAVFADGDKGMEDPSALTRDGWYYQNAALGDKINWYFYDGTQQAVTLGNFSAYAIMTFDSSAAPILGVYTAPTGTNDVIPGFAHSRVAYSAMSPAPVVGKKYLVYFGQNPSVHPELPRIQLGKSTGASIGEQLPSEVVLTVSFGTNSNAAANSVKFMVESLGVYSPTFKSLISLKIKHVSKKVYDAKVLEIASDAEAKLAEAKSYTDSQVSSIPQVSFNKETKTVDSTMISNEYFDLAFEAKANSLVIFVSRLGLIEGYDYSVSVVGGVTRVTFLAPILVPSEEALEVGDVLNITYAK